MILRLESWLFYSAETQAVHLEAGVSMEGTAVGIGSVGEML